MTAIARIAARAREDLSVIGTRDPSIRTTGEALLHPSLIALWGHRLAHPLHRRGHRILARLIATAARIGSGGIEIHPGAVLGRRLLIDHGAGVVIGETAILGDDITIYQHVTLGAVGWWHDNHRPAGQRRHPRIGDRAILGAGAAVLGPVDIGPDTMIGAHTLILDNVPAATRVLAPRGRPRPQPAPTRISPPQQEEDAA